MVISYDEEGIGGRQEEEGNMDEEKMRRSWEKRMRRNMRHEGMRKPPPTWTNIYSATSR